MRLRVSLSQRTSMLAVPEFLHPDGVELNPVLLKQVAEEKKEARRQKQQQMAGTSTNTHKPGRYDGVFRRLNLDISSTGASQSEGTTRREQQLHIDLRRQRDVRELVRGVP